MEALSRLRTTYGRSWDPFHSSKASWKAMMEITSSRLATSTLRQIRPTLHQWSDIWKLWWKHPVKISTVCTAQSQKSQSSAKVCIKSCATLWKALTNRVISLKQHLSSWTALTTRSCYNPSLTQSHRSNSTNSSPFSLQSNQTCANPLSIHSTTGN